MSSFQTDWTPVINTPPVYYPNPEVNSFSQTQLIPFSDIQTSQPPPPQDPRQKQGNQAVEGRGARAVTPSSSRRKGRTGRQVAHSSFSTDGRRAVSPPSSLQLLLEALYGDGAQEARPWNNREDEEDFSRVSYGRSWEGGYSYSTRTFATRGSTGRKRAAVDVQQP